MTESPVLDLLHPDYIRDPYPMFARMLRQQPIAFDPRLGGWLIGRYRDVMALHRDPRLSCERMDFVTNPLAPELRRLIAPLLDWYKQWIVMADPPRHTRLRRLAIHAFQPRNLARMEGWIKDVVDELIDAIIAGQDAGQGADEHAAGEMEVMRDLAYPLPQTVISKMVGIPEADRDRFIPWTNSLLALLTAGLSTAESIEQAKVSHAELRAYFAELVAERRSRPVEGEILSELIVACEDQDKLTADEVVVLVANLMAGGYETTTHLLANGLLELLSHPDQLALVRQDPRLIPGAVEETLRYSPSIMFNTRAVLEPIEYEGARFEPGQILYFITSAANRDPERFTDPQRFDVTRANNKHLTFGFGIHFCIGAPLARMEARIAFERLFERLPGMYVPEQPLVRLPNMAVRPLEKLVVRW